MHDMPIFDPEKIEKVRKRRKLSRKALAELVGVTEGAIHHIEKGRRTPRDTTIEKIAEALSVSVKVLLKKSA